MPTLKTADAEIYYEEYGAGFPVLCFAPGGQNSRLSNWRQSPRDPNSPPPWFNPIDEFGKHFRVIVMDQRNAGQSRGAISASDDWTMFARDHLALLDHLGIARCHTMGGCIGATFCLTLCKLAPERIAATIPFNPIGIANDNRNIFFEEFDHWAAKLKETNPVDDAALRGFARNLYSTDFVFSVTPEFVSGCDIPMLVMPGTDAPHPPPVGHEIARLAPRGEMVKRWRGGEHKAYSGKAALDFLLRNTPAA